MVALWTLHFLVSIGILFMTSFPAAISPSTVLVTVTRAIAVSIAVAAVISVGLWMAIAVFGRWYFCTLGARIGSGLEESFNIET
jgi:hypothetical protein